jgi:hypothetical protein
MSDLDTRQIELARHALGLPNRRNVTYRNHFVAGPGHTDYDDWERMVESGHARKIKGSQITGGDPCFELTRAGANAALTRRERLDREDWP